MATAIRHAFLWKMRGDKAAAKDVEVTFGFDVARRG
jgi:hypothetical protein